MAYATGPTGHDVVVAKQCTLDWLGAALRGSREPVACAVCAATASWSHGTPGSAGVTLIGRPERAGLADAAFVNGVAGHALDYDDTMVGPLEGHPTAPILPAVLALAEHGDRSGADLLAAFVAGVRCAASVGARVNPAHYRAGWHATATLGTFGAAAACATLLELEDEQIATALAFASVQAAGVKAAFGTAAKAVQVGRAAATGLQCALLAAQSLVLPTDLVERAQGFVDTHGAVPGDLRPVGLEAIRFKRHAACHGTHAAIEAVANVPLGPAPIERIDVEVATGLLEVCDIDAPATGLEAKFSLRTVTAMRLLGHDTADPDAFHDGLVDDRELVALAARTTVHGRGDLTDWEAYVTIHGADGSARTGYADVAAEPGDPADRWPVLRAKFARLAAPILGADRTDDVAALVLALDGASSVRPLLDVSRAAA